MIIKVFDAKGQKSVTVTLDGISDAQYQTILVRFKNSLKTKSKVESVTEAFLMALHLCPNANPADLWWHVVYRSYLDFGNSDQSWKRTAGYALERAFVLLYRPLFAPYGIKLNWLDKTEALRVMKDIGIDHRIGSSKLDIVLYGTKDTRIVVFGGVHVKSSLAERIQDDVPASLAMMEHDYWSGFVTLDAKAFPPPHGDAVVRGELGFRNNPQGALKRNYFERDGQFDNCYSYNLRTDLC